MLMITKIIDGVLSDIGYIQSLPRALKDMVSGAFVKSLIPTNGASLTPSFLAIVYNVGADLERLVSSFDLGFWHFGDLHHTVHSREKRIHIE